MKLLYVILLCINTAYADINTTSSVPVTVNTGVDARNMSAVTGSDLSKAIGVAVAPSLTTTFSETST